MHNILAVDVEHTWGREYVELDLAPSISCSADFARVYCLVMNSAAAAAIVVAVVVANSD